MTDQAHLNQSRPSTDSPQNQARAFVEQQVQLFFESFSAGSLRKYVDARIERCFDSLLRQIDAHAGAVWIKKPDADSLVISYNVGRGGSLLEGAVEQSLDRGLVSKSYSEDQTVCHRGLFPHRQKSDEVDKQLRQITAHQIATPIQLFGQKCGVLTTIQTLEDGNRKTEWGFDEDDVQLVESWAAVIMRLLEYNFLRSVVWR